MNKISSLILSAALLVTGLSATTAQAETPDSGHFCTVSLTAAPPSRTTVILSNGGDDKTEPFQVSVTWDPAFDLVMAQRVWLPDGNYNVLMTSESAFTPGGDGLRYDRAWVLEKNESLKPSNAVKSSDVERSVGLREQPILLKSEKTGDSVTTIQKALNPGGTPKFVAQATLGIECVSKPLKCAASDTQEKCAAIENLRDSLQISQPPLEPPAAAAGGGRSLLDAALPLGLSDALSILTEVIVERAKSYASSKLKRLIEKQVCVELKNAHGIDLRNLCKELESLDFFNLAASGKPLLKALLADVGGIAKKKLEDTLANLDKTSKVVAVTALAPIWIILTSPASEREAALGNLARTVVYSVLEKVKSQLSKATVKEIAKSGTETGLVLEDSDFSLLPLAVIGAGVAFCNASAKCDLQTLWQRLQSLVIDVRDEKKETIELKLSDHLPELVGLSQRGANLLAMGGQGSATDKLRQAVGWLRDIVEFSNRFRPIDPHRNEKTDPDPVLKALDSLDSAISFIDAALAADGRQIALAAGGALLHLSGATKNEKLMSTLKIITGLAPIFAEAPSTATPAERAVFRADKKLAIEQLIDGATERRNRKSTLVGTLGGSFGVMPGATVAVDDGTVDLASPLSVGLGFGWANLPNMGKYDLGGYFGFNVLDLGQFLTVKADGTVDDVRVSDVLAPGIQGGFLVGDPEMPISLLFDARFRWRASEAPPTEAERTLKAYFQVGFLVGFQIPIMDFN